MGKEEDERFNYLLHRVKYTMRAEDVRPNKQSQARAKTGVIRKNKHTQSRNCLGSVRHYYPLDWHWKSVGVDTPIG
jgi:hypothetical protein